MTYEPQTPVLVAVLNNPADWDRIRAEGWYRIPVLRAPRHMAAAILALYQTRAFSDGGCVRWYAPILGCQAMARRDLLPGQPDHPRAAERYWRLELGPLAALPRPIRAARFRCATFIPTCWERLLNASDLAELWMGDQAMALLCDTLQAAGLSASRRRLRDADSGYPGAASARPVVEVRQTLAGLSVSWPDCAGLTFDLAEVIWDAAGCAARVVAALECHAAAAGAPGGSIRERDRPGDGQAAQTT